MVDCGGFAGNADYNYKAEEREKRERCGKQDGHHMNTTDDFDNVDEVVSTCLAAARSIAHSDVSQSSQLTDDELKAILRLAAERMQELIEIDREWAG